MKKESKLLVINTVQELLDHSYHAYKHDVAMKYKMKNELCNISYEKLYCDIMEVAATLSTEKMVRRIAVIVNTSYEMLVHFYGILYSGNIAVMLDKNQSEEVLTNMITKTEINLILFDKITQQKVSSLLHKFENITAVKIDDISLKERAVLSENFKLSKEIRRVDKHETAMIIFTSGTTGTNKAVPLSHYNLCKDVEGSYSLTGDFINEEKRYVNMTVLPHHHAYQITVCIQYQLAYGGTTCISEDVLHFTQDLKFFQPSALVLVPLIVESMYKKMMLTIQKKGVEKKFKKGIAISKFLMKLGIDIRRKLFKEILDEFGGNLSVIHCGGADLAREYIEKFHYIGIEIFTGYGITECSPVVAVNSLKYRKYGSAGKVLPKPYAEVKIVDDEILIRGDVVTQGYYNDLSSTKESFVDGWFHTGDLGYIDKEGFLFITGRKKNLIILSNGENISPEALEKEILKIPYTREVMVHPKKLSSGLIILAAQIYPNYESDFVKTSSKKELFDYFNSEIIKKNDTNADYWKINAIDLREEEFPKNTLGKIIRIYI